MVFLAANLSWSVSVPPESLHAVGLKLKQAILLILLEKFAAKKADPKLGHLVAVTSVESIGDGKISGLDGGAAVFPVTFRCISFKPMKGEVLVGVVKKVIKHGVFMDAGPLEAIFLSEKAMGGDLEYVGGDGPCFIGSKMGKMGVGSKVRFRVLGIKWMEVDRVFQVLATMAGDFLGPISED